MYKAKIYVILKTKEHSKNKPAAGNRWNLLKEKEWVSLSRDKHY